MAIILGVEVENQVPDISLGLIVARGGSNGPASAELQDRIREATAGVKSADDEKARTGPVRDMLRHGKYKPTGRGKPASEYLLGAAKEGRFPSVGTLVDALNWVSLVSLLPISLIDLERAATARFVIRRGRKEENYVFNASGQVLDLEDLLLVALGGTDTAVATPIKDSMATKLLPESKDVLAVVWAPKGAGPRLVEATQALESHFRTYGGAKELGSMVI